MTSKTAQLEFCRRKASNGGLADCYWLGTVPAKNRTLCLMSGVIPVVPVIEQPHCFSVADLQHWFDVSRMLAEVLCACARRQPKPIFAEPMLAEGSKLTKNGWDWSVWQEDDSVCPSCGAIGTDRVRYGPESVMKYCIACGSDVLWPEIPEKGYFGMI